jgi:hypothetical protein
MASLCLSLFGHVYSLTSAARFPSSLISELCLRKLYRLLLVLHSSFAYLHIRCPPLATSSAGQRGPLLSATGQRKNTPNGGSSSFSAALLRATHPLTHSSRIVIRQAPPYSSMFTSSGPRRHANALPRLSNGPRSEAGPRRLTQVHTASARRQLRTYRSDRPSNFQRVSQVLDVE